MVQKGRNRLHFVFGGYFSRCILSRDPACPPSGILCPPARVRISVREKHRASQVWTPRKQYGEPLPYLASGTRLDYAPTRHTVLFLGAGMGPLGKTWNASLSSPGTSVAGGKRGQRTRQRKSRVS